MTPPPWRLIRSGALSGALNMALDQALLERVAAGASPPVLRLYRWDPPAVTLGYGQRGGDVVNLAACRELGFDVVRRPTGGRAVLHRDEVTYAVIAPEQSELFPGGIAANYRVIARALQALLASFGLETELAPGRPRAAGEGSGAEHSACFTAPAVAELVHCGRKVTGSAQKRQGGAFLQHGSVPLDLDLEQLFAALDTRGRLTPAAGAQRLGEKIGWLNRWRSVPVTVAEAEERLIETLAGQWGVSFAAGEPTSEEWLRARALVLERFADPGWTLAGIAG